MKNYVDFGKGSYPVKKRAGARGYDQNIVNTVILTVILGMLLYLVIQISSGFYSKVSTQRTQKMSDFEYSYLDGCIFRDDSPISASGDVVYYTVQDGEKVGVGQVYAEVYSDTGLSDSEADAVQKKLNDLSAAIALLESGIGAEGSSSHLGQISEDILSGYYAYIDSVLAGDITSANKAGDKLLSGLVDHSAVTSGEAAKNRLGALVEERDGLLASLGGTKRSLVSDKSFNFFYAADGYENANHTSRLDGLTPKELDRIMSSEPAGTDGIIGKATESSKWYLALPLDRTEHETFKELVGITFTVDFLGFDGLEIDMLLESIVADEENGGAYMLMSSHDLSHVTALDRLQSVRILLDSYTGYRIPSEALQSEGGRDGVYILVGNVIEFRRVTVIGSGDDYYIVATYESDAAENPDEDTPYLNINDMIVTSGNDLYDGKQLD